jgi:hypothetical protein
MASNIEIFLCKFPAQNLQAILDAMCPGCKCLTHQCSLVVWWILLADAGRWVGERGPPHSVSPLMRRKGCCCSTAWTASSMARSIEAPLYDGPGWSTQWRLFDAILVPLIRGYPLWKITEHVCAVAKQTQLWKVSWQQHIASKRMGICTISPCRCAMVSQHTPAFLLINLYIVKPLSNWMTWHLWPA